MIKIAFALGVYCFIGAVHAKQPIDAPYGYAAEVIGLTMILTDTELPGGPILKEEQLADVGCTYQVTAPELVSQILKIVESGIYGVSTVPVRLRHAIYISMRNKEGAKYLFAEGQGTRGTVGSIEASVHPHTVYYFPRRDVPDKLRAWARDHIAEISFTPPKSDPSIPCTFAP